MMTRFFAISSILLVAALSVSGQTETRRAASQQYAAQWKTIDKLMEGILPQSALPEIEKVRQAALRDKEYGQFIKAVMIRNTCLQLTEEKPQTTLINSLIKDAETIPFPAKAMVYSLIGEAYLNYYDQNRWKLYDRTTLAVDAESGDMETWDAARLIREVVRYYRLSLTEPVSLQKVSIGDFSEALEGDASTRYLRPTLYDFLAHRVIDAYLNSDLQIMDFSQTHVINDPAYFGAAKDFVQMNFSKTDTLAPTYLILKLFQDLTAFRMKQNDINSLTDVNLKRYNFLKNRGNFDDVDALYDDAMKKLVASCAGQKIWGKVAYTLANYYHGKGREWPEYNAKQSKHFLIDAVNLCREIEKYAPLKDDRKLAADMLREITQPDAGIIVEKNLIPHQPALALISCKNLHTACLSIYCCNREELEEFYRSKDWKEDAPQFLAKLEKAASHILELPALNDYQKHSFETKIDALPIGNYLLVLSDKPHPEKDKLTVLTFQSVQVTGIKLLQRRHGDGKVEVYTVDARSGRPLSDARITMIRQTYDRAQSRNNLIPTGDTLRTDTCGTVLLQLFENQWSSRISVTYGNDELTENLLSGGYNSRQPDKVHRTVFFTDRAIYRPGQTVYFKGLLYETDNDGQNAIKPNVKTTVKLIDVNGREVAKQEITSGEYGSFNGSFTLPQGLLNGRMNIQNEHGNAGISVEEYKRPTFEIVMDPVTAGYMLGDTVTMTGTALALAGYPVDGAKMEFNVVRHQQFRPLWRRVIEPSRGNSRHIAKGTLYTDSKGRFAIRFPARDEDIKLNDLIIYRYQMTVDITDINGETQSETQEVKLSRMPVLINCQIPDRIFIDGTSDSLKYPLKTTNLNGNDVVADVQVEIWSLKNPDRFLRNRLWPGPDTTVMSCDEFTALFPNDPYNTNSLAINRERTGLVATLQASTPKDDKIDLGVLRDAPSGWYMIKIEATRPAGSITDSAFVQLQRHKEPIMSMDEWLTVVKDSGEPGETAVFRIAGANDSSLVRYDVLFKNHVVERKWMTVGRIPQELRLPVTETYRGGFAVAFAMVQDNREYIRFQEIKVPYTNKELDVAFTTFRGQLLPGEKEKWTLTVKNKKGESEAAEMVATLYDASLDIFAKHHWMNYFYPARSHGQYGWNYFSRLSYSQNLIVRDGFFVQGYLHNYERLKQETWSNMRVKSVVFAQSVAVMDVAGQEEEILFARVEDRPLPAAMMVASKNDAEAGYRTDNKDDTSKEALTAIPLRTNFSETAFFYPELRTNKQGEMLVEFTIPEALTRWNMMGFAHTKDFKTGETANSLITQKQVAISANLPRFFRTGDTLILSAKVNNLTGQDLNGKALLRLYDAFTMQAIDTRMLKTEGTQTFAVKAGQSAAVQWKLVVPATLQAVTYRLTAQAGNHTDGEERSVPVLSNRTLVTETMPFMVRGDERKDFRFDRLTEYSSGTMQNHRLTLEYTSNPAWYAVQALPYIMEYPYECAEQVFSRFYANILASSLANRSPRVKQIFDQWRSIPESKALISNLEKNQELKQALLEETPWLMQASNETERKKRIGLLFDLNRMAEEQKTALEKLKAMQGGNGGFPWFAGMSEDRFVTQHIVAGLEHLRRLNVLPRTEDISNMIERAMAYCDARISEDYKNTRQRTEERTAGRAGTDRNNRDRLQINRTQLHYLYMSSFSKHYTTDQQAFDFYMQQAERSWSRFNIYEQAMIALTMHRFGKPHVAQDILRSLKERAQMSDDLGMYWVDNRRGYFWSESPVETQTMLIEAFNEAGSDTRAVSEMKIWLLRNKQTTDWKTTKATAEAIYALLSTDDELLGGSEPLDIRIGGKPLTKTMRQSLQPEAGTGYANASWEGNEVNKNLANLRVANPNSNIAWGAMFWQYFEDMDKITSAETNLQITKKLFIKRTSLHMTPSQGGGKILEPVTESNCPRVGDIVTVRMELRADRDFEYVHLKDMRAAGFEPVNALSGYRFQGGLGYYENIRDASVNFFIGFLRQGTYVFEYDLRVTNAGDFSGGITTFQCMYAPEFNAHSGGGRIKVHD